MKTGLPCIGVALLSGSAGAQCFPQWLPGASLVDVDRAIHQTTIWDPDGAGPASDWLVLVGGFDHAGAVPARRIAAWDGERYHTLGGGVPLTHWIDTAYAACVHQGELYIGGSRVGAGTPTNAILRWNGQNWVQAGNGLRGRVGGLCVHEGRLIATGSFVPGSEGAYATVAVLNDGEWSTMGSPMQGLGYVVASTPIGLIAGGYLYQNGNPAIRKIARWDGQDWQPMGQGIADGSWRAVLTLAWYRDHLYAGGWFPMSFGAVASHLVRWNGTDWEPVPGMPALANDSDTFVASLRASDQHLYIAGDFEVAGIHNVARWDGQVLQGLGHGLGHGLGQSYGQVYTVAEYQEQLIAAGSFKHSGADRLNSIAAWSGEEWRPLSAGTGGAVNALVEHEGAIYAGGDFGHLEGVAANAIARRAGNTWEPLPATLPGHPLARISHLASHQGKLFAVGSMENKFAVWDGTSWTLIGEGLDAYFINTVCSFGDDFVVGGQSFGAIGGLAANNIARWDGQQWRRMQASSGFDGAVTASTIHKGELYVGGNFNTADGLPTPRVARWTGAQWVPVGDPSVPIYQITAMTSFNDNLIVGGWFLFNLPFRNVAAWDGSSWISMGDGVFFRVLSFTTAEGVLFAGGGFGQIQPGEVARWTGATWESLGSTNGEVRIVAGRGADAILYAGGSFFDIGGQRSVGLARFGCPACYPNCDASTTPPILNVADFSCFLQKFAAGDPYANCDGSTTPPVLNVADFGCFLTKFAAGCP
jgi:trimeric autotransporter adhesin